MAPGKTFDPILEEAASRPLEGWDFSWLATRMVTAPPPWNFEEIVLRLARGAADLLDLGTGGGERLAAILHRPPRTVATEAWAPNVEVASRLLRPLGVTVVRVEGAADNVEQTANETRGHLPFAAESFELVTNRHEAFVATEVARILTPGGRFVTQQLGGEYEQLYRLLDLPVPRSPRRRWTLGTAIEQVQGAGLDVAASGSAHEITTFTDVGALAWYLRAVPWAVPSFSIVRDRARLASLHARIAADGPVSIRQPAFWLEAVKAPD